MLNVTSTTLELSLPTDTKDVESVFNGIPALSKKDFSQVFDRQISAGGEDDVTKKTENILNQSRLDEQGSDLESTNITELGNIEITLDDLPDQVELIDKKLVVDGSDLSHLNDQSAELIAVTNNELTPNTESKAIEEGKDFSEEFIHLLAASEKLLPQNGSDTIAANSLNNKEADVTKQGQYDITGVLLDHPEAVPLTLLKQNNNQATDAVQVPQLAEKFIAEAFASGVSTFAKEKLAGVNSELVNDEFKGDIKPESITKPLSESIAFSSVKTGSIEGVKADSVDVSALINNKSIPEKAVLETASTPQATATLQASVEGIVFDDINGKPIIADTINVDESIINSDIKRALSNNELPTDVKQNILTETRLNVTEDTKSTQVIENTIAQKPQPINVSGNVNSQVSSVGQTLAEAENHKELVQQNTLLNENYDRYKLNGKAKENDAEQAYSSAQNSKSDVSSIVKPENNFNENIVIKNTEAQLFNSQVNGTIVNNENDTRFNDISTNAQSVDGFSNRFVAESVQQNKLNVNQQVETININDKNFSESVKEKVLFAISQKLQQIDIQLDPPELGNVHVRVNVQGEAAAVNFLVQHQQTKESLEQHMDKLKDMLADSGVNVGDANVEQQKQEEGGSEDGTHNSSDGTGVTVNENNVVMGEWTKDSTDGVDFYA